MQIHINMPIIPAEPAGSATTGFNPDSTLLQVELPILGLAKEGQPGGVLIRSALEKLPGVERVIINAKAGIVVVDYDPETIQILDIVEAIKKTGYQVGGAQKRIGIENIRCASCVGFIEDELKATPGVLNASVNLATQEATVDYLPEQTSLNQLNTAIESWGYKTRPATSEEPVDQQQAAHEKEYQRLMRKFWFAAHYLNPGIDHRLSKIHPHCKRLVDGNAADHLVWSSSADLTGPLLVWK